MQNNRDEIFLLITSKKKWYFGGDFQQYCSQQAGSEIVKRFRNGSLSDEKIAHLFDHFGYYKKIEQWEKK